MDQILEAIKIDPLAYLPERSPMLLRHFLAAYVARHTAQSVSSRVSEMFRPFEQWLCDRYSLSAGSRDAFDIISSYSDGTENAFANFFVLFAEFEDAYFHVRPPGGKVSRQPLSPQEERRDVVELIRAVRQRPELHIGFPHFTGFHAYLNGHQAAGRDLGLPLSEGDGLFDKFKHWVEQTKNHAKPRPWSKVIQFQSPCDCGHTAVGAYCTFLNWLDQFAQQSGKPDLFKNLP